ncbi:carboxypeptidase regulatory-like domain-containing protein [Croceiramulus getboli]|nr:carboxypeptidase regulatory-like domain-containing protein [Flavobacteriaceae bacterium YJPT1-3]
MRLSLAKLLVLISLNTIAGWAQQVLIQGSVIDELSREPLADVQLVLEGTAASTKSDADGQFKIQLPHLEDSYVLVLEKDGYLQRRFPVLIPVTGLLVLEKLTLAYDLSQDQQFSIIALTDEQVLGEEASTDLNIAGVLGASKEVFLNAAAYDFSATFFRPRGLDNAYAEVLINGVRMNRSHTGRPQWGSWGGLNDVQRNQELAFGLEAASSTFGGLGGSTNITMRASSYRSGGRFSLAGSNRSYQGRIMASYHTGLSPKGLAISALVSRRMGEAGFVEGTVYEANSFFLAVERALSPAHSLQLAGWYTPVTRGRSSPLTREVVRLKGRAYNPYWGIQNGQLRNSRLREIKEPVVLLSHFFSRMKDFSVQSHLAYQWGAQRNSRIDNGGTRLLITPEGQETYLGGARNPAPDYYQRLPSYFLRDENPSSIDFQYALLAEEELQTNGQLDWDALYQANGNNREGNATYILQNDVVSENTLHVTSIADYLWNDQWSLQAGLSLRNGTTDFYAEVGDLLGSDRFLDVDFFAQDEVNIIANDLAQSDLQQRNRWVVEGDRYKYNYQIKAFEGSMFAQGQYTASRWEGSLALRFNSTSFQRVGLFENGNFPGALSVGVGDRQGFSSFSGKLGMTYKWSGTHQFRLQAAHMQDPPPSRLVYSNARQNHEIIDNIRPEVVQGGDLTYFYRSSRWKARTTLYYFNFSQGTDLSFYFTQGLGGLGSGAGNAFVQEVVTGIGKRHLGVELGVEAQLLTSLKLKMAAAWGDFRHTNDPELYLTSDDFDGQLRYGSGRTFLNNYKIASGPEIAAQLGLEYRDPDYWWVGLTTNYFAKAYVDPSALTRSEAFVTDFDGKPFINYDPLLARRLLRQEPLGEYILVNVVGGKSWRIKSYYVGFFAVLNNVLDTVYRTGGFEQSRYANYPQLLADQSRPYGPLFGTKYFYGAGPTFYVNAYVRF